MRLAASIRLGSANLSRRLPSEADPSATHAVRSGVDERLVTNGEDARDGLVSDHSGFTQEMDTYGLAVASAFFAYFLCGGKESKCCPAQGRS
jgi:hypothetical protein